MATRTISALRRLGRWRRRLFLTRRERRFRIFARLWFAVRTAWSWRLLRLLRPLTTDPRLAFTRRRIFPVPPLFSMSGVALLLGVDEFLPRVAVVASWPPITTAGTLPVFRGSRRFLRLPQLSALEPHHHCGWMLLLQAIQGREQFVRLVRSEGRGLAVHQDRPVRMAWRHPSILRPAGPLRRGRPASQRTRQST